jgi:hypothetical protein
MHPFGATLDADDTPAAAALLAEDVVFHSPIILTPFAGRSAAGAVLAAVSRVFDDFADEGELTSAGGRDHALLVRACVDDKDIQGCDVLRHDQDGRVVQLTVMVRPLTAALALRDRMAAELAQT